MQDSDAPVRVTGSSTWDPLAEALRDLRTQRGDPSYAEIARLVSLRRGGSSATRVARTTVYDAFRTGRTRVNLELVREIAAVLGADDAQVDHWVARCRRQADPPPEPAPAPGPTRRQAVALMVVGVLVNPLGRFFIEAFHLPIFLDMVGTAIVAIALGPWRGAAVGAASNLIGVASSGPASLAFMVVNVAGALVWGYGVRRPFDLGRTHLRFLGLNLLVALTCTLLAVPLLLLVFGGTTGHAEDLIARTFLELTGAHWLAVSASNLVVSVGDKLMCGFIALTVLAAAPACFRHPIHRLVPADPAPDPTRP